MFGARPRSPRPVLLLIVFGVLLALVGITATAQAVMVSVYASTSTLNAIITSDVATLRGFAHQHLGADVIEDSGPSPDELARLEAVIATLTSKDELLRVELRLPDGRIVAASEPGVSGLTVPPSADFAAAIAGNVAHVAIVPAPGRQRRARGRDLAGRRADPQPAR